MTENFKKYLWLAGVLTALIFSIAVWRFADAYNRSVPPTSFRNFTVSGEGKATAIPDVAEFSFSVTTQGGKDIASLQNQNTTQANGAIDFIKSQGVDSKDIQTSGYSISPRYQNFSCPTGIVAPCPPSQIIGYTVTQTVTIKIRDFSKLGDILSGVVSKGVNTISGPNFTMDDPNQAQNEARAKAIQNAETRAQTLAQAGHFEIGRLLSIEDVNTPTPYPLYAQMGAGVASSKDLALPTIEPGSQEITADVILRYEIQ